MTDKNEAARTIRSGAKALRRIAARETDPKLSAEIIRVAAEIPERTVRGTVVLAGNEGRLYKSRHAEPDSPARQAETRLVFQWLSPTIF